MVDSDAEEFGKCRVRVKDFVALADVDTRHLYTEIRDTARSMRATVRKSGEFAGLRIGW